MPDLSHTPTTNPFRAPTAQEWIAQNAPAPPLGPAPPLPFLPEPQRTQKIPDTPLAIEQLYGPQSEPLLGDVVDNTDFSPEHQQLALAVLAGEKPLKKLVGQDRAMMDEIAHQMATAPPKGKSLSQMPHKPKLKVHFDEDTSFDQEDGDFDPDQAYSLSDSDRRG